MTETTTIEITAEQKAQLDELRAKGQAYKHIIGELIENYSNQDSEAMDSYSVSLEATERRQLAQEIAEELR